MYENPGGLVSLPTPMEEGAPRWGLRIGSVDYWLNQKLWKSPDVNPQLYSISQKNSH